MIQVYLSCSGLLQILFGKTGRGDFFKSVELYYSVLHCGLIFLCLWAVMSLLLYTHTHTHTHTHTYVLFCRMNS